MMRSDPIDRKPPALPPYPPPPGTPGMPSKKEIESFLEILKARVAAEQKGMERASDLPPHPPSLKAGRQEGRSPLRPGRGCPVQATASATAPPRFREGGPGRLGLEDPLPDEDRRKLRKAVQDFEAVFMHLLLREMRKTVPKVDLMGGGLTVEIYRDMMDEILSQKMAEGGGMGLGEMLYRQLVRDDAALNPESKAQDSGDNSR